jgi:hypothetical protein
MTTMYTNSSERTVSLDVPITPTSDVDVTIRSHGDIVREITLVDPADGLEFSLPFALTQSDAEYEIEWRFTYVENGSTYEFKDTREVDIVTPILPLPEVMRVLGEDFDEQEAADVERAVRYIIQAHTGQFFGKYVGKKYISGSGEPYLRLPMRLISMNKVNGNTYWNENLALRGSGWYLQSKSYGVPTIRADFDGWHENPWGYSNRSPIVAPYTKAVFNFIKHAEYEIDGVWGWKSVPQPVQEAARLLINDYACADSLYRDRFLTSMTAADWRIQFHEGAFSNTGNVRANQLLSEFVLRRGWVVV